MKYIFYFLGIIFLITVNFGILHYFKLFGVVPNLLLIFLLVAATESQSLDFFYIAILSGLFLDAWSGLMFGSFTFVFLFLGFLLHLLNNNLVLPESAWKKLLIIVFFGTIVSVYGIWLYNRLALHWSWTSFLPENVRPNQVTAVVFYNLLACLPVYLFYNWMKGFVIKTAKLFR